MITLRQIKAARAFLGWSQSELAVKAGLSAPTIKRMETRGLDVSSLGNVQAVIAALEGAGVTFLEDDGENGKGVRARDSAAD